MRLAPHWALLLLVANGSVEDEYVKKLARDAIADGDADRIVRDDNGYRVLHAACEMGLTREVSQLLSLGADPMSRTTTWGVTPLHVAAWNGQLEVARILLDEADVDINDHQFEGVSPLGFAISKGDYALASLLLSRGAKFYGISHLDDEGEAMLRRLQAQFKHVGGRREHAIRKLPNGRTREGDMGSGRQLLGTTAPGEEVVAEVARSTLPSAPPD